MKLAAGYVRMSDPDQDLSPEQQWSEIEGRAAADGYRLVATHRYEDRGKSGWKAKVRRPDFDRMNRDVRSGRLREAGVDRLYVWKLNRLARTSLKQMETINALEKARIELVSLTQHWGDDPKMKKVFQTFTGMTDEFFSDGLSEDVRRGMRSQGRKGYWMYGHIPHGYVAVKAAPDAPPRLAPDPAVFPLLRRVVAMRFEDGDGHRKIAERLTRERVPPPSRADVQRQRAAGTWRPKHVKSLLSNLVYTGAIPWRDDGKVVVLCDNAHESLFTRAQWELERRTCAQRTRAKTTRNPVRIGERGIFTPWMRCALCAGPVKIGNGGHPGKPLFYYQCVTNFENRETCEGLSSRVDLLDPVIERSVQDAVFTEEGARTLIRASIAHLASTPDAALAQRRKAMVEADRDLSTKIDRLVTLAEEGVSEVGPRLRELGGQRDQVRADLAALPQPTPAPTEDSVDIPGFRASLLASWTNKPVMDKRQALSRMLDSILVDPAGSVTIRYAWRDPVRDIHQSPFGPPYAPMSIRVPSASMRVGSPASMAGLPVTRWKSPPSASTNIGSPSLRL